MKKVSDKEIQNSISFFGRTIGDAKTDAVFFNWSGSGFEIFFEGKRLDAFMLAIETVFPPEGTIWPWVYFCIQVLLKVFPWKLRKRQVLMDVVDYSYFLK